MSVSSLEAWWDPFLCWWRHVHQWLLQKQSVSEWRNLQWNLWAHQRTVQLFLSSTLCWKTLRDSAEKLSRLQSSWRGQVGIVQNYRQYQSNPPSILWFWFGAWVRMEFDRVIQFVQQAPFSGNLLNTSDSASSEYPNTERRVENTKRSGVFLTKFEVFGDLINLIQSLDLPLIWSSHLVCLSSTFFRWMSEENFRSDLSLKTRGPLWKKNTLNLGNLGEFFSLEMPNQSVDKRWTFSDNEHNKTGSLITTKH